MFDIIELNGKKVAELREIAGKLGIARTDKLKKQDLVYSHLDEQAAQPSKANSPSSSGADSKTSSRTRRAKPSQDKPAEEPHTQIQRARKRDRKNNREGREKDSKGAGIQRRPEGIKAAGR